MRTHCLQTHFPVYNNNNMYLTSIYYTNEPNNAATLYRFERFYF